MPSNRTKLTTAPALVHGVFDTIHVKRNDSIMTLQGKMETTSQWLDDAITSAKRKIVEGTGVSIQEVQKKAKTTDSSSDKIAATKQVQILSPIRDKENSPNTDGNSGSQQKVFVKPPPSAVKRKVNSMRVVDLRKELKSKGHETKGLKKDLQQRLLQAYTTVETIMSPPKAAAVVVPTNINQPSFTESSVEQEEPNTTASETHPDSQSVEMVVFDSPSVTDKKDKSKAKVQKEEPQSADEVHDEFPDEVKNNDDDDDDDDDDNNSDLNENEDTTAKESTDVEMTAPSKVSKSPMKHGGASAMDIEPTKNASIASSASEGRDKSANEKRISLMDCDEVGEDTSKLSPSSSPSSASPQDESSVEKIAVPKVTASLEAPGSKSKTPSVESKKDDNHDRKESECSRNMSQESLPKATESVKVAAKSTSTSSLLSTTSKTAKDGSNKDAGSAPGQPEKQLQSPIKKRVQAAIQMFTAATKSPVKPKPSSTTPSKLSWLTKNQTQAQPKAEQKNSNASSLQQIQEEGSTVKEQVQQKAEKLAAAARRPVMGSASSNASTSSSAFKGNRFMAGNPSSALSSSAQATNEARKARLAEIRGKSKPVSKPASFVTKTLSATKDLTASSLSALKAKAATAEDSKRKLLTAQMREKAAARKQMEVKAMEAKAAPFASAAVSAPHNDTAVLAKSIVKQASAAVQAASSSAQAKQQPSKKSPEKAPVKSVKAAATPDALSALRPQLLSPMDTYEISDREGSDSESESESECEDDRAPRKKIPVWAQRANLIPALEKQFAQGKGRFDPDEIFPEVKTCDLQAIFNSKRSRYIRRTSSANWSKDRVTPGEKLTYKRTMGFAAEKKR